MLLATGAVHHHLVREELRTRCGIVCETGEAREVAHIALLIGYGAGAVNPYLAFQTLEELVARRHLRARGPRRRRRARKNYVKACDKGLLKTFAKMGISTLQSYRGAQIFEAVGLDRELVARCFTGTRLARLGRGLRRARARGGAAPRSAPSRATAWTYPELDPGGLYQWRARGERHTFNPETVSKLQHAVRRERRGYASYKEFSRGGRRRRRSGSARCAGCSASAIAERAGPARGGRAGQRRS